MQHDQLFGAQMVWANFLISPTVATKTLGASPNYEDAARAPRLEDCVETRHSESRHTFRTSTGKPLLVSGRGYLRAGFRRWWTLYSVRVYAGDDVKIVLPVEDGRVCKLLGARSQRARDAGIRTSARLASIDPVTHHVARWARSPCERYGVGCRWRWRWGWGRDR